MGGCGPLARSLVTERVGLRLTLAPVFDRPLHRFYQRGQIQLYATNAQLPHPYVSPCWGYLGGLCPILVIASDKELLRDEIVYMSVGRLSAHA